MLGVILLGLLGLYLFYFYSKVRKFPPGPIPFPLVGNLPQLSLAIIRGSTLRGTLRKWQEQYGDINTLWIGPMPTVNICDYAKAQETMVKKGGNFSNRPNIFVMWIIREGRGVIASNGQHWLEQRRFALHTLRNFGLGRNLMEDRIMLEVDYRSGQLSRDIEKAADGKVTINPARLFDLTVGNIINRMLFSERFTEESEERFFKMKNILDYMMENASIMDFFLDDWNIKLPFFKSRYDEIHSIVMKLLAFVGEPVRQRQAEIAAGKRDLKGEPEDYVDAFLMQIQKDDNDNQIFNEEALIITLLDLWFAGQETTSTTLYWAFSYLTLRPKVIEKAQAELDKVTGRNRSLGLADKPNTPYLNAIIAEVLRVSQIVPLNLWRDTAEDTQVGDYKIEKGTAITAQISLMMTDPKKFEDPLEFDPDRFLNSNLEQYSTPFGMGKRACLGESLARAELYLIIGNLLNSFNIKADPNNMPSFEALKEMSNVRRAKPYKVTFSKRN